MIVRTMLLASAPGFAFGVDTNGEATGDIVNGSLADDSLQNDLVVAEDDTPGADDVVHSVVVAVDGADGETFDSITVDYPETDVDHATQDHDEILTIGVDTDADGDLERTVDENDVSGVNLGDDSVPTVTFDAGYTLSTDDRQIRYEGADNPDSAGEYDVSVTLNDGQTTDGTLSVE